MEAGTRTDRRRERTRAKLVAAGRALIAEKGVAGLRIGLITERADVALGSFHNHFADKDDLVAAIVGDSLATLAETVVDAAGAEQEDPALVVSQAVRRVVRLAYEDPDFARLVVNLSHAGALVAAAVEPYARRAVEAGIAAGRFAAVDVDVTLTTVTGGALALVDAVLEGRHGPEADAVFAVQVLCGLGVDRAEAEALASRPL